MLTFSGLKKSVSRTERYTYISVYLQRFTFLSLHLLVHVSPKNLHLLSAESPVLGPHLGCSEALRATARGNTDLSTSVSVSVPVPMPALSVCLSVKLLWKKSGHLRHTSRCPSPIFFVLSLSLSFLHPPFLPPFLAPLLPRSLAPSLAPALNLSHFVFLRLSVYASLCFSASLSRLLCLSRSPFSQSLSLS